MVTLQSESVIFKTPENEFFNQVLQNVLVLTLKYHKKFSERARDLIFFLFFQQFKADSNSDIH